MRAAPAVTVTGGAGWAWRAVQSVLPALAAAALCAWALLWVGHSPWLAAPLALAAFALAWRLARPQVQTLRWDGQVWAIDGAPGRLALMIDLGSWILLRLRPDAGARACWLALAAGEAGPAWPALRAAVYSRPSVPPTRVLPPERAAD